MDLTSSFSDINEIIFTNYTTNDSNCFIFTVNSDFSLLKKNRRDPNISSLLT